MAERDYKFTEKEIQEKFLKYKRISIEQINPELLSRKDLSFVDEFNNFKSKNNQYEYFKIGLLTQIQKTATINQITILITKILKIFIIHLV